MTLLELKIITQEKELILFFTHTILKLYNRQNMKILFLSFSVTQLDYYNLYIQV